MTKSGEKLLSIRKKLFSQREITPYPLKTVFFKPDFRSFPQHFHFFAPMNPF